MKKTDKAFWLTIIPAVLIWNLARGPLLETLTDETASSSGQGIPDIWTSVAFAGILALVAGYVSGVIARPQYMRGAGDVAFGLLLCLGVQNYVDHRGSELTIIHLAMAPSVAAALALIGGLACRLSWGRSPST